MVIPEHLFFLQRMVAMRTLLFKVQALEDALFSERVTSLCYERSPEVVHADQSLEVFEDGVDVYFELSVVFVHLSS